MVDHRRAGNKAGRGRVSRPKEEFTPLFADDDAPSVAPAPAKGSLELPNQPDMQVIDLLKVRFYDDELEVVRMPDGKVLLNLRRLCESVGVEYEAQRNKLRDKERCPWATTFITKVVAQDGKLRELVMLDLDCAHGWLFTLDTRRVDPEVRDKIVRYQKECVQALRDYFMEGAAYNPRRRRYDRLGKPGQWVQERLEGVEVRKEFTAILQAHDVHDAGFAQCTNAIYRPVLGGPAVEVKERRGIRPRASLRDNLSGPELAEVKLAEATAGRKIDQDDVRGNRPCADVCGRAGAAIHDAVNRFLAS